MTLNSGIELHLHTTASDGRDTPQQILEKAKQRGLTTLAFTDHGNFAGVKQALELKTENKKLEIIPGVEFEIGAANIMFHLLAYFPQLPDISTDYHRGLNLNPFKRFYGEFRHKTRPKMLKEEIKYCIKAIEAVREENGVPVVAHPNDLGLKRPQLSTLIRKLAEAGLGGLEVYNHRHPPSNQQILHEIAEDNELIKTSGTDYHGDRHQLGENKMKQEWLRKLKRELETN